MEKNNGLPEWFSRKNKDNILKHDTDCPEHQPNHLLCECAERKIKELKSDLDEALQLIQHLRPKRGF